MYNVVVKKVHVRYLISWWVSCFHFIAVRYFLHKCSKMILWLKRQFNVHVSPIFCALEFLEAEKLGTKYRQDLNLVNSILWRALQQNCIVKTSEILITWSTFCYTAGSDKSYAIERVLDQILTRNSSGDEIANVNFLYDDIVHALKCNGLLHKFRHRSLSATQVYQIRWNNAM